MADRLIESLLDQAVMRRIEVLVLGNHLTDTITIELRDVLLKVAGNDLAAIWLYGATVFGHPSVDIDLHIVLRRQLSPDGWEAVRDTHIRLAQEAHLDIGDLDFWYISLPDAMGSEDPAHLAPWTNNLSDSHWCLHRAHWLAGRCEVVYGFHPAVLVRHPSWEELEAVLRRELRQPEPSAYWVLQVCRVWASLATRDVVRTKIDAGEWALGRLAPEHHGIVQAAICSYERFATRQDEALIRTGFPPFLTEVRRQLERI